MHRLVVIGCAVVVSMGVDPVQAGGEPTAAYKRLVLPPHIAYRDPAYVAQRRPVVLIPIRRLPRSLALPLYNEPPPRFQAL